MKVAILTGGGDKPYAIGLLEALVAKGICVDFIGNDEMGSCEIVKHENVSFFNLRGDQTTTASKAKKIFRVLLYYIRLIKYVTTTKTKVFHILWCNKFIIFDRTILNIYYKILGKKIVYTAHNVDERERDGGNNILNSFSLRFLYRIVDHIFVHTQKMKSQLVKEFKLADRKIEVIPFGVNNTIPKTKLSKNEAKKMLGCQHSKKVMLFFGNIAPYKGVEYAIHATSLLRNKHNEIKLIIAGQIKGCMQYWMELENIIEKNKLDKHILKFNDYIPDEEVERFFKCADVVLLPYKFIYQSGVLFLAYSFGIPVIATDVGSLKEDIIEGKTGMICLAEDAKDLANKINYFFNSEIYKNEADTMKYIISYVNEKYSWEKVTEITRKVYCRAMARQ